MKLATASSITTIKIQGATFTGRVVPVPEVQELRRKNSKSPEKEGDAAVVDNAAFALDLFDAAIMKWEGVTDLEKNEIPFETGKIRELVAYNSDLPMLVLKNLNEKFAELRGIEEKN